MTKIICGVLLAAAFACALYLILTKRKLEKIRDSLKTKNAFTLATFICCAMIMFAARCDSQPDITCYAPLPPPPEAQKKSDLVKMLKMAWLVLDNGKRDDFRNVLHDAVQNNLTDNNVSSVLLLVYDRLSEHIHMTQGSVECYNLSVHSEIGINSSRNIIEQLKFLNKAKNENKLSPEIIQKVEESIAYDIETLKEYKAMISGNRDFEALQKSYSEKQIRPADDVKKATEIIVEMEKKREKWDLPNEPKKKTD